MGFDNLIIRFLLEIKLNSKEPGFYQQVTEIVIYTILRKGVSRKVPSNLDRHVRIV